MHSACQCLYIQYSKGDKKEKERYLVSELEKELNFARSSIYKWNKNIPSAEKLKKVAERLDKPMEYFFIEHKKESEVTTTMTSKEKLDNTYLLEAYYMFFCKGTTFELSNGHVTGTYESEE